MIRREFRQWAKAGVFQNIRRGILAECDAPTGIGRHWQAADGTNIEAPPAQESIDPSPKDPGKNGCKRRALAGGHGVPLSLAVSGTNRRENLPLDPLLKAGLIEPEQGEWRSKSLPWCSISGRRSGSRSQGLHAPHPARS